MRISQMTDREIVAAYAEKYARKALQAFDNYQETGRAKYDSDMHRYEALAEALQRDAAKADDRAAIAALRSDLARLGHAAAVALEYGADTPAGNKALQDLAENAAACARLHDLIADTRK